MMTRRPSRDEQRRTTCLLMSLKTTRRAEDQHQSAFSHAAGQRRKELRRSRITWAPHQIWQEARKSRSTSRRPLSTESACSGAAARRRRRGDMRIVSQYLFQFADRPGREIQMIRRRQRRLDLRRPWPVTDGSTFSFCDEFSPNEFCSLPWPLDELGKAGHGPKSAQRIAYYLRPKLPLGAAILEVSSRRTSALPASAGSATRDVRRPPTRRDRAFQSVRF